MVACNLLLALKWTTLRQDCIQGFLSLSGHRAINRVMRERWDETKIKQKATLCKGMSLKWGSCRALKEIPMAGAVQAGFGQVYGFFERITQKAEPQWQGNVYKRVPDASHAWEEWKVRALKEMRQWIHSPTPMGRYDGNILHQESRGSFSLDYSEAFSQTKSISETPHQTKPKKSQSFF